MPFFFCIVISKSVPNAFQYKSTAICNGNKAQQKETCPTVQERMDFSEGYSRIYLMLLAVCAATVGREYTTDATYIAETNTKPSDQCIF